jgi:hypothetical protein
MNATAKASMRISSWEESAYSTVSGTSLAQADSPATFTGDLEGSSKVRTLLVYPAGAAPSFIAHQTFEGSLHGRTGSFVLEQSGRFEDDAAHVTWKVVPGSGTGELAGLSGAGGYVAPTGTESIDVELTYEL